MLAEARLLSKSRVEFLEVLLQPLQKLCLVVVGQRFRVGLQQHVVGERLSARVDVLAPVDVEEFDARDATFSAGFDGAGSMDRKPA